MKLEKGDYGYLAKIKREKIILCILLAAGMACMIGFGYYRYHTMKTIFTVIGILFSLPIAKVMSGLLVIAPFTPLSIQKKQEIENRLKEDQIKENQILWDLALSSMEKVRHFPCVVISDKEVFAYYPDGEKKQDYNEAKTYFSNLLKNNSHRVHFNMTMKEEDFYKKAADTDFRITNPEEASRVVETIFVYEM
ncbi:MAG: hypothetical protein Q4B70_13535 [Lachnospiraceae bacterium]|nr:hypothetical protein [Lachnospiraceae bacterium]